MIANDDLRIDEYVRDAAAIGRADGMHSAQMIIEDGDADDLRIALSDPYVLDPPDLSGQWADDPTDRDLIAAVTVGEDVEAEAADEICGAYLDAASDAFYGMLTDAESIRRMRARLAKVEG